MEWLHKFDTRLVRFVQEKFSVELSASSTYLLAMVDSLGKNVDKYITKKWTIARLISSLARW